MFCKPGRRMQIPGGMVRPGRSRRGDLRQAGRFAEGVAPALPPDSGDQFSAPLIPQSCDYCGRRSKRAVCAWCSGSAAT